MSSARFKIRLFLHFISILFQVKIHPWPLHICVYLASICATATSGAKNQNASEQKPNSSFHQHLSEIPAWLKGGYGELCAGGSETWHNCPLAHTVWPSPSPTWGADVLLCEMLSPGSHQRWRAPPPCSLPLATFSANSSTSQDMFSHRLDQDYMSTSVGLCTKVVVVFQVPKECNPINFSN